MSLTRALYYAEVHLFYASFVWFAAWILTSIRPGSATTKYWIWVATSLNFVLPMGALLDKLWTSHLSWAAPLGVIGELAANMSQGTTGAVVAVIWLLGTIAMATRLVLRLRLEHRRAQAHAGEKALDSMSSFLTHGIPVTFSRSRQTPAVDGVLRPHISLPKGIDRLLTQHELDAVLIHEVTHARRRDNLIRLIHEVTLCALWFHPLVWTTGSRLSLYRELSCDERVIQSAHGDDLVSALAKLANPEEPLLLQATASSYISHRLARLASDQPQRTGRAMSAILSVLFAAVIFAGVYGTVAHTACCFLAKK